MIAAPLREAQDEKMAQIEGAVGSVSKWQYVESFNYVYMYSLRHIHTQCLCTHTHVDMHVIYIYIYTYIHVHKLRWCGVSPFFLFRLHAQNHGSQAELAMFYS